MKEIDHLALDGHALELFLAVLEEGSVTAAATRLGLTQSTVSHALNKLRRIAGDPLFAKSGRGIVATAHAQALATKARALIDEMRSFAGGVTFEPASAQLSVTIAANDFQRDLLLPRFFGHVAAQVKSLNLRVIPSQSPSPAMLRENRCDLLITPLPPSGIDIVQKRLLSDHYVCYYDPKARAAPVSRSAYLAARHVTVVYTDNERLDFDRRLAASGFHRVVPARDADAGEHAEPACRRRDARLRPCADSAGLTHAHAGRTANVHGLAPALPEGPGASLDQESARDRGRHSRGSLRSGPAFRKAAPRQIHWLRAGGHARIRP